MRISRIRIQDFRNFHDLDLVIGGAAVVLGENQIGKTNLLHALRLVLDPALPDSARQLRAEDFWDGIPRPLTAAVRIRISVDFADFEQDEDHLAVLAEHIVQPEPMVARLTYEFGPVQGLQHSPSTDDDFEFITYGGDRPENRVGYEVRKQIPLEVLHALRDAEGDLARWSRSPLKPLIERAKALVKRSDLDKVAKAISAETDKLATLEAINKLAGAINAKLKSMSGPSQTLQAALGFSPADPDKLLRALRLLFDEKSRDISEASLGAANVLYLALRSLDLEALVDEGNREHTFFAIEEPEAHLHPHLQRLVYRSYLKPRQGAGAENNTASRVTYLLTTHSPHIASVTPIASLILLRKDKSVNATIGVSGAAIQLTGAERDDVERYLDVSRAEGLFSRGVILVEGDAEKFLVPALAARAGYDLDSLGISVCSVAGTNFAPYVKFFGPKGIGLPFAVITDLDPYMAQDGKARDYGRSRAHALCPLVDGKTIFPKEIQASDYYESFGIFLNGSTLEIALNDSGCIYMMNTVMQEICDVDAAKARFAELAATTQKAKSVVALNNPDRFIGDIEYVGKGRFAQRLCAQIESLDSKYDVCPPCILKAIKHVLQ